MFKLATSAGRRRRRGGGHCEGLGGGAVAGPHSLKPKTGVANGTLRGRGRDS